MKKLMAKLKVAEPIPRRTQVVPLIEMTGYRPPPNDKIEGNCPKCQETVWVTPGGSVECRKCGAVVRQEDLLQGKLGEAQDADEASPPAEDYETLGYEPAGDEQTPPKRGKDLSQDPQTSPTDRTSEDEVGDLPLGVSESLLGEDITDDELEAGLKSWVKDYISARKAGNVKLAKQIKKNIDKVIKKKGLDPDKVYSYYGDPDDPKNRQESLSLEEGDFRNKRAVAEVQIPGFGVIGAAPDPLSKGKLSWYFAAKAGALHSYPHKGGGRAKMIYQLKNSAQVDPKAANDAVKKLDAMLQDKGVSESLDEGAGWSKEMGRLLSPAEARSVIRDYEDNEEKNNHTGNYLLLAQIYGTTPEVSRVKAIIKSQDSSSMGVRSSDIDWMGRVIGPYYKLLRMDAGLRESSEEKSDILWERLEDFRIKILSKEGEDPPGNVKLPLVMPPREAEVLMNKWRRSAPPKGKGYDKVHFELMKGNRVISKARMDLQKDDPVDLLPWVRQKEASLGESLQESGSGAPVPFFPKYRWWVQKGMGSKPDKLVIWGPDGRVPRGAREEAILASGRSLTNPGVVDNLSGWQFLDQGREKGMTISTPLVKESLDEAWDDYVDETKPHVEETSMRAGRRRFFVGYRDATTKRWFAWNGSAFVPEESDEVEYYGNRVVAGKHLRSARRARPDLMGESSLQEAAPDPREDPGAFALHLKSKGKLLGYGKFKSPRERDDYYDLDGSIWRVHNRGVTNMTHGYGSKYGPQVWSPEVYNPKKLDWMQGKKDLQGRLLEALHERLNPKISGSSDKVNYSADGPYVAYNGARTLSGEKWWLYSVEKDSKMAQGYLSPGGVVIKVEVGELLPKQFSGSRMDLVKAVHGKIVAELGRNLRGESTTLSEVAIRKMSSGKFSLLYGPSAKGDIEKLLKNAGITPATVSAGIPIFNPEDQDPILRALSKGGYDNVVMESQEDLQELKKGQKYNPDRNPGGLTWWSDENVDYHGRERADALLYQVQREQGPDGLWRTNLIYATDIRGKDIDDFIDKLWKRLYKHFSDAKRKEFENDPGAIYGGKTNRDAAREARKWKTGAGGRLQRESEETDSQENLSEFGPQSGYAGARFAGVRRPGKGKMSPEAQKTLAASLSKAELLLLWLKAHLKKSGWEDELRWKNVTFPGEAMAAAEKSLFSKKLLKKAGRNLAITDDGRAVSDLAGRSLEDFRGQTITESSEDGLSEEDFPILTQEMLREARTLEERMLEVEYLGLVEEPSGKKGLAITIGGHQYHYAPTATNVPAAVARSTDGGVEKLAKKFKKVLALSPGRALAWLRKNAVAYAGTKKNPLGDHNRGHLLPDPGKKLKKSKEY